MASSSGNSSGSSSQLIQKNSGSEEDLQVMMDQRKRKRMQSNRESARRSRMRKQKNLDDLMAQLSQLKKDNHQILTSINITTEHYMDIETQNSILRAQLMELSQRLESLNEILNFINTASSGINLVTTTTSSHHHHLLQDDFMNTNTAMYLNQPIMASADMLPYYY